MLISVIRKRELEPSEISTLCPVEWLKSKGLAIPSVAEDMKQLDLLYTVVGKYGTT